MPKTLKLESSDQVIVVVDVDSIRQSALIDDMLKEMEGEDNPDWIIPVSNVNGNILHKVIKWCNHHKNDSPLDKKTLYEEQRTTILPTWDEVFLNVDQETLFGLIEAANYLDIKRLLDFCCKHVANMIKAKTAEQIRRDFEKMVVTDSRDENQWYEESDPEELQLLGFYADDFLFAE